MAMTYIGAESQTKNEMAAILNLPTNKQEVLDAYEEIMKSIQVK